jgi:hypothetical protein
LVSHRSGKRIKVKTNKAGKPKVKPPNRKIKELLENNKKKINSK